MVERVDCLCGARTEGTYSGTWVQCGDCGVWQHWACVAGPRARPPAADEPWACGLCTRDAAAVEVMQDCGTTLVVCPAPILQQWHAEIMRHITPGPSGLKVVIYEGQGQAS